MSDLFDSFRQAHAELPSLHAGLAASRQQALNTLLQAGLPGPRSETWKYTSLRALARHRFAPATATASIEDLRQKLADVPGPRAVFVNGRFSDELSMLADLPQGVSLRSMAAAADAGDAAALSTFAHTADDSSAVFALANSALAVDGVQLKVAAGAAVKSPLHLVLVSDGGALQAGEKAPASGIAWHLRHQIEIEAGAEVCLVQHEFSLGQGLSLGTAVAQLRLADSSSLQHLRVQQLAAGCSYFQRNQVEIGAKARYQRLDLELGLGLSRHELNVQLAAAGAFLRADGVLLGSGAAHCDTRLGIVHAAPDCECQLTWRGLGDDRSRVAFHGGITINEGADGSEAMLSNKNLLLSEQAEVDTQPVLIIHADEVKAAHGATVGRLDPTALFYLQSRGLPADQARQLLTAAFCRELLTAVADESLREMLTARLDAALSREEVA